MKITLVFLLAFGLVFALGYYGRFDLIVIGGGAYAIYTWKRGRDGSS